MKSPFNTPAVAKTRSQCAMRDTEFFSPFNERKCFTFVGNPVSSTCVSCLFASRGPSNVFGFIPTVSIKSVNGVIWRGTRAYIGEEVFELSPPRAKPDPPPTVVVVAGGGRYVTASFNSGPYAVFSRQMSVHRVSVCSRFVFQAPAAFDSFEIRASNLSLATTCTQTFPYGITSGLPTDERDDCEAPELFANTVFHSVDILPQDDVRGFDTTAFEKVIQEG